MSHIPFFDLKRVYEIQKKQIQNAVLETLESGHYILGNKGKQFEQEMKDALAGESPGEVVGCNSGTDAIQLALLALNVGVGDEVITVSHTAIPTLTAIQSTGATPVLVDIHPETWVFDPKRLQEAITPKTKAVIGVHLYGNMVDIFSIQKILAGHSTIAVIEDCAQSQGSSLNGKQAGTLGRFGTYSFYPTKNVGALGDGGAVFAKTPEDASILKQLRYYGQKDRYHADIPRGVNSRLDEIQAAILSIRLKSLNAESAQKQKQVDRYRSELGKLVQFQKVTETCTPAWHLCVIALESNAVREKLKSHLDGEGVQTLIHYPIPTHLQPAFKGARKMNLETTESLAGRILSLPMNLGLTENEQTKVIESIRRFFN